MRGRSLDPRRRLGGRERRLGRNRVFCREGAVGELLQDMGDGLLGPWILEGLGVVRERLGQSCRRSAAALLSRMGLARDQRYLRDRMSVYREPFRPPRLQRHRRVPSPLRLSRPHGPLM